MIKTAELHTCIKNPFPKSFLLKMYLLYTIPDFGLHDDLVISTPMINHSYTDMCSA